MTHYKLLLLTFFCVAATNFYGQVEENIEAPLQQQNVDTEEKLKTILGVKFSLGLHTFTGSAFDNTKPLFGFGVGVFNIINLNKNKKIKLQWELNLGNKGSKFSKPTDTTSTYYDKIAISYAELPIFLSFQLTKNKNPLHLLAGCQFSALITSKLSQGLGSYGEVKHNNLPFKKIDIAPSLGFRKDFGSGISCQFMAKYGVTNIYTSKFDANVTPAYIDVFPPFKDGSHDAHNLSFELSFLFGI